MISLFVAMIVLQMLLLVYSVTLQTLLVITLHQYSRIQLSTTSFLVNAWFLRINKLKRQHVGHKQQFNLLCPKILCQNMYGSNLPPLPWKQRLELCIGAARGLYYLHTGAAQGIIHRYVKTTNILLDENFVVKLAEFGHSKTGSTLDQTHLSTTMKYSFR